LPLSQSRNKGNHAEVNLSKLTLNWKVTLLCDGKKVCTTDYSAGIAHCPYYKRNQKSFSPWNNRVSVEMDKAIRYEVENGKAYGAFGKAIEPNPIDVIYSLVSDSDVINYDSFEAWANEFGMDSDSRKAEKMYNSCLSTALKLRNGIGESAIEKLREASQDY
jgi:hypothetical protein